MTVNDPDVTTTKVTRTYGAKPEHTVVHQTEVRESSAAWWIGAIVAIVAILAVVFLVTRSPSTTDTDLTNAIEQGRTQGALEATQSSLSSAQAAADRAAQTAADATSRAASDINAASARAADSAAAAANRAADRVDNAIPPITPPAQ